jgi:hypothetical protein
MEVRAYRTRTRYPSDRRWLVRDYWEQETYATFEHPRDSRFMCENEVRLHVGTLKELTPQKLQAYLLERVSILTVNARVGPNRDTVNTPIVQNLPWHRSNASKSRQLLAVRSQLGTDGWWRKLQVGGWVMLQDPDTERGMRGISFHMVTPEDAPDFNWSALQSMLKAKAPPSAILDWLQESCPMVQDCFAAPDLPPLPKTVTSRTA